MFINKFKKTRFNKITTPNKQYALLSSHNGLLEVPFKEKQTLTVSLRNRKLTTGPIIVWDNNNKINTDYPHPAFFWQYPLKSKLSGIVLNRINEEGYAVAMSGEIVFLKSGDNKYRIGKKIRCEIIGKDDSDVTIIKVRDQAQLDNSNNNHKGIHKDNKSVKKKRLSGGRRNK